jgi:hypothetical protein
MVLTREELMIKGAKEGSVIEISLSNDELHVIYRCLNEICHGVNLGDDGEFETRIGAGRLFVRQMLHEIAEIFKS